ncbi:hypothetical protein BO71DRAFT_131486 [Aspergillus ellipticus CBS 707.79]|uniref:Uncharacterized protein n=1 Tax=Aspergillus ellipticus CBS 707.79 TaxID=1448320 RepID=A0A319CTR6_9EURO|nr:hypothetical protein BO71DRAFT_131486 [Aspergillus ellipticus CBS 707.79]
MCMCMSTPERHPAPTRTPLPLPQQHPPTSETRPASGVNTNSHPQSLRAGLSPPHGPHGGLTGTSRLLLTCHSPTVRLPG